MSEGQSEVFASVDEVLKAYDARVAEQRLALARGLVLEDIPDDQITWSLEHQAAVAAETREKVRVSAEAAFARLREEGLIRG